MAKPTEIEIQKILSDIYHNRHEPEYAQIYNKYCNDHLLVDVPNDKNKLLLDCGCGTGILLKELSQSFSKVIGLDLSLDNIKKVEHKKVVVANMEDLPFSVNSFDVVFCRGALHHVPDFKKALNQISQIICPGGVLVLYEPNDDALWLRPIRKIFFNLSPKFREGHKAFRSLELIALLKSNSFEIKRLKWLGYIGFPLCVMPDLLPIIKYLPFKKTIGKILVLLDEVCSNMPLIKTQSWCTIISATKLAKSHFEIL